MGKVQKVEQHEFASPTEILPILLQYKDSLGFTEDSYTNLAWLSKKRYGILIFLDDVVPIPPFSISKKGFGSAAAWLCIPKKIDEYKLTVI
jgi:hypothetical protein